MAKFKKLDDNEVLDYNVPKKVDDQLESPKIFVVVMFGLMLLGLAWLIVSYLSNGALLNLGNWNLLIGFIFIIAGFAMTTKWK
jgi:hypothetical protein